MIHVCFTCHRSMGRLARAERAVSGPASNYHLHAIFPSPPSLPPAGVDEGSDCAVKRESERGQSVGPPPMSVIFASHVHVCFVVFYFVCVCFACHLAICLRPSLSLFLSISRLCLLCIPSCYLSISVSLSITLLVLFAVHAISPSVYVHRSFSLTLPLPPSLLREWMR